MAFLIVQNEGTCNSSLLKGENEYESLASHNMIKH